MSNKNENENERQIKSEVEDMTSDLRGDNWKPFVKAPIHVEPSHAAAAIMQDGSVLTPAQMIAISHAVQEATAEAIANSKFNPNLAAQVVPKSAVTITDFSNLTLDDVYDLSVNIEAKAFMSADVLKIDLKDTNFEARWVNKNPQRLGSMLAKGFTYVTENDLLKPLQAEIALDAQKHYSYDDVVAMKIDKATYYSALRAAHIRAIATTNQANAIKRAANSANQFMQHSDNDNPNYRPADFNSAKATKKMEFYDPNVGV